jgi:hypothetical protein
MAHQPDSAEDRQKRREFKREVVFEAMKRIATF